MAAGRIPTTANSPITAKGDLFTYSTAPARLAVGNDGEQIVADSAATTGLRYSATPSASNPVLNSAFQVWQRGTTFALAASTATYTADRWQGYRATNTGLTISRQVTGDTTNLPNIQYSVRAQRDSGVTTTNGTNFYTSFESANSIPFAGKTVTLSFYARKGANFSSTSDFLGAALYTGTGTDQNVLTGFTGSATPISQNATLTTTWQRFTYTATLASTATQIGLLFSYSPTGTAGAADYFDLTGVQIDIGSVALPFRTYAATIQGELAACQRYFQKIGGESNMAMATGGATAAGAGNLFVRFPVVFRTAPSFAYGGTLSTDFLILTAGGGSAGAPTALTQGVGGTTSSRIDFSGVSGLTAGYVTGVQCSNTNANLQFSAEL